MNKKQYLFELQKKYSQLRISKEPLMRILDEVEYAEHVYNSNAIENSTLSLQETERILLDIETKRKISLREVFETKNLFQIETYLRNKQYPPVTSESILFLHRMLLHNISESIAGRYREHDEYVRVGNFIAAAPTVIMEKMNQLFFHYEYAVDQFFLEKIARFHLIFESIHPFNDGNGRIGRVIINLQLRQHGFPPVIIRNKEKNDYYAAFQAYHEKKNIAPLEKILFLALCESLHKRLAYLEGREILSLVEYAKRHKKSLNTLSNAARRQTIPAFRERGVWKIGI